MNQITGTYLNWDITIDTTVVGKDVMLQIYGGSHPHLGASVLSVFSKDEHPPFKVDSTLSVLSLIGHKEAELFSVIAKKVTKELHCNCLVSGGIHIDNLTGEQINQLIDYVLILTEKAIIQIKAITV